MKNYIVQGSVMEYMYTYHITAGTPEIAAAKWQQQFPLVDAEYVGLIVVEAVGGMAGVWKHSGYMYETAGYSYIDCAWQSESASETP